MIFLALLLLSTSAFAETQPLSMANVSVENDVHWIGGPGTDHGYSQGLKFSHYRRKLIKPTRSNFLEFSLDS
jgi:hypothetical protein